MFPLLNVVPVAAAGPSSPRGSHMASDAVKAYGGSIVAIAFGAAGSVLAQTSSTLDPRLVPYLAGAATIAAWAGLITAATPGMGQLIMFCKHIYDGWRSDKNLIKRSEELARRADELERRATEAEAKAALAQQAAETAERAALEAKAKAESEAARVDALETEQASAKVERAGLRGQADAVVASLVEQGYLGGGPMQSSDEILNASPRPTLLIVEDHPGTAESLAKLFTRHGFACTNAGTVETAIPLLDFEPHWMILDLGLPGATGVELIRRLRARHGTRRTKIAVTTGTNDDAVLAEVQALRPEAIMRKPVDLDRLIATIRVDAEAEAGADVPPPGPHETGGAVMGGQL